MSARNRVRLYALHVRDGDAPVASVRLADRFWTRLRGLLFQRSLAPDQGLWLAPGGSIHMLGMRFAIDAVFLGAELDVLAVRERLAPGRIALAPRGTRSVLELAAGRCAQLQLRPGTALRLIESQPGASAHG